MTIPPGNLELNRTEYLYSLQYGPRPPAEQASLHTPSVALEWAATASFASTGCTRNAVSSSALQMTLITADQS